MTGRMPAAGRRAATRAVLTVSRGQGGHARVVVEWATAESASPGAVHPLAGRAVVSDLLAGDATCDAEAWLRIADVIICGPCPAAGSPAVLRSALSRYPGCVVAAAGLDDGAFLVSAPGTDPVRLTAGTRDGGARPGALACAVLAFGWLVAGLPLESLRPARLQVIQAGSGCPQVLYGAAVMSALYSVSYELAVPGPVMPSRSRSSPASGAPACS